MGDILTTAVDAAKVAGDFLNENFGKISRIESKGDRSLATNLDKEAEAMIIDKIRSKFPTHGILAEESGGEVVEKEYIWIIDPLDGTHNFIRGLSIYGVSIGVLKGDEFIAGVIYMPKDLEMYAAEKGGGAYKNQKKIVVSTIANLKESSCSFDSSIRYKPQEMLATLGDISVNAFNVRMLGSSARVLAYVAEGKLDFSVEFYDQPWDFAGGVCLIEEAGGKINNIEGKKLTYQTIGYVASNGIIHDKVQQIVLNNINK